MDINSNFDPPGIPPVWDEAGGIDANGELAPEAAPAASSPFAGMLAGPAAGPPDTAPLEQALAGLVRGKDINDPATLDEAGRQILIVTMQDLFGPDSFGPDDLQAMAGTFHQFIQDDPYMKNLFQGLLQDLANS